MVSRVFSQLVPVRSFRILSRGLALWTIASMCLWKWKCVPNVTPRILGYFSRRRGVPLIGTIGWRFDW